MSLRVRKNKASIPKTCPIDEWMRLLGGAWASHVIWFLSAQPRRFGELRRDIPGISARVLSARLRELRERGVVTSVMLPTTPPSAEYMLTDAGRELVPALAAIARATERMQAVAASPKRGRALPSTR